MIQDATNRSILAYLRANGRASNSEIARSIGLSEAAVRQRIKRLLAARVIRFRAVVDASFLGVNVTYFIRATVRSRAYGQFAMVMRDLPPVAFLSRTSGSFNAFLALVAPDEDFAKLFLESWFENNPNVLRYEADRFRKVYKYDPDRSMINGVIDDFQSFELPGEPFSRWLSTEFRQVDNPLPNPTRENEECGSD